MCMCVMCVYVCDVYVHACDEYVHVCDVDVCDVCVCVCVHVCVHVCDVHMHVQLVQMKVHISLLHKGCVRGGTSTSDVDQYATRVY